jgi:hypothetical protein
MINGINNTSVDDQDPLVSFIVISLFTKILINDAINVIRDITDEETATLAKVCLESTYFSL